MSADNGVYILSTPRKNGGREYRVEHLQSIENVDWDEDECKHTADDGVRIENAREMWSCAKPTNSENEALREAAKKLKSLQVCEYGISFIEIEEPW